MPTLNLQQLLSSDTIGDLVEKINQNFSQIATNGGGPQGSRGIQGPPGLPGLRGESGPAGDAGTDAKQVTIVDDDPLWGSSYTGDPLGTTVGTGAPATAAIAAGYNEGDIWIDNSAGVFYDIHETGVGTGIYVFVAHPISPATLTANEYWLDDTDFSAADDTLTQGLRLAHKHATLSLTGEDSTDLSAPTYASSAWNDTLINFPTNIYGYQRVAFKLSIDSRKFSNGGLRITSNGAATGDTVAFNLIKDDYSPLLFLNSTGAEASNLGFGILHYYIEDFDAGGDIEYLSIANSGQYSGLILDVARTYSTGDRISFAGGSGSSSVRRFSFNDLDEQNVQYTTDSKLWMTISTQDTGVTSNPFGAGAHIDNLGMRLRKTPAGNSAVSFYVQNGDSALVENDNHVMSILDNNVHITNRNSVQTNSSDILRAFKFAVESDDSAGQQERIAIFKGGYDGIPPFVSENNREYLGIGIGDFKYMGTGPFPPPPTNADRGPAIIYSLYGNTDAFPTSNWNRLLLQPRNEIFDSVNTGQPDNTGAYGVSIGTLFNSRFGVEGNFAIGESAYQLATAPDYGGIIQGQVGIGRTTVLGTVDLQVAGSISTDTGFIGWNTYFDTDFRRTAAGPLAWIKQENLGSASQDYLGIYAGATGSAGSTATAGPIRRMSIRNQSGFVGIDTINQAQKLTINKTATANIEGLQIIDESSGMSGASAGLQFRLDGGNTGQIGFTSSAQATNDIEIFTAGEKRINIDGSTGRVLMHRNYTGSLSATAGTSTLEVKNGSETKSNVTVGTFRGDTIDTLDQKGGGYVGYNSNYNETSNVVTYNDRQGTSVFGPGAAGAMTFVDNVGGWHVAPYYVAGLVSAEEERDPSDTVLPPTEVGDEPPTRGIIPGA